MRNRYLCTLTAFIVSIGTVLQGQTLNRVELNDTLTLFANRYAKVLRVDVKSQRKNGQTYRINVNENLSYMPFTLNNVEEIKGTVKGMLAAKGIPCNHIEIYTDGVEIADLITNHHLPKTKHRNLYKLPDYTPIVTNQSLPYKSPKGLDGVHMALWGSHGYHFDQKLNRWEWQRARLLQTVEDLYTTSYTHTFLVPMLENAGAYIFQPRERDLQRHEAIVDNDKGTLTEPCVGEMPWQESTNGGFAHKKRSYSEQENPFTMGTYLIAAAEENERKVKRVVYQPTIPETGEYAVYVSYKSLPESTKEAHYTVLHAGGQTKFLVNQRMSGGTWVYLGTFLFKRGSNAQGAVVVTNGGSKGRVVTTDAVKFGGGMGNIARKPLTPLWNNGVANSEGEVSGYPRSLEGARYWMQWSGIPDSVYNFSKGENDYTDDFSCRGFWVNYLTGGSASNPKKGGLNTPLQLSLGFHTDAGVTPNDSVVGTLTIFTSRSNDKQNSYPTGVSRYNARDFTDMVQTQLVEDIQSLWAPEWQRRALFNRSYSESRVPEVPSMILELLSHQNFADMRYGHDPRFKFTASRAIYKAILKYVHLQYGTRYVVQPLPVKEFSVQFETPDSVLLNWSATPDSLEKTAEADYYIVYTQTDDNGFDNGTRVEESFYKMAIEKGKHYSFKVVAGNRGGISFPSETLSAYRHPESKGTVLIVNGFDRLAAPESFAIDSTYAGFKQGSYGVPYQYDMSYIGAQYEYKRNVAWADDDAPGFGASYANYESTLMAGNTFNYPRIHGHAFAAVGYSYTSCAHGSLSTALLNGNSTYAIVDVILGKQKTTYLGTEKVSVDYPVFTPLLREALTLYANSGGNIVVSGCYLGSDVWESATLLDQQFSQHILGYTYRTNRATLSGAVKGVANPFSLLKQGKTVQFNQTVHSSIYAAESVDAIEPSGKSSFTVMRYADSNKSAAVAQRRAWRSIAFGFPLETILNPSDLEEVIKEATLFFEQQK